MDVLPRHIKIFLDPFWNMPKLGESLMNNEIELQYINGTGDAAVPVFQDIRLSPDTIAQCELVLEESRKYDRPIRNAADLERAINAHTILDQLLKDLNTREAGERAPWNRILSQISAAFLIDNQMQVLSSSLRKRITDWNFQALEGRAKEADRLASKAEEKRQEAKYAADPQKKRAAVVASKQYDEQAKVVAPKPEKGVATEIYYEARITNRVQAARLSEESVEMEPNQKWFDRDIKQRMAEGTRLEDIHYPGIQIEKKARSRFYR